MKNLAPKKIRFVFNPYPLQSKVEEGYYSGYFTEDDIPKLLEHYDIEVFKQVKLLRNIDWDYPLFVLSNESSTESLYDFLKRNNITLPLWKLNLQLK